MSQSILRTREFQRILLIKPSALGDVIHTVPVLAKLRERYPDAQIDWLLKPQIADLIGHHPALSNVIPFDRKLFSKLGRSWTSFKSLLSLARTLWTNNYDLVIDLHGQLRSAFLTLATGARFRVGFDRPRREAQRAYLERVNRAVITHGWKGAREGAWLAYSHRIEIPTLDVHAVDRYLTVCPMLGIDAGVPDFTLTIPEHVKSDVEKKLRQRDLMHRPFVVLVPGTVWETKHWRSEGYADVAKHLLSRGYGVVLAGSPSERVLCQRIADECPGAHNLAGETSVSGLAALIERASLSVTNDSGSMHLTVALHRPVVSIFGPTDPIWIGPYGRPRSVLQVKLPCSPCYLKKLSRCAHQHQCMRDVTAPMVIERIEETLANSRPANAS